MPSNDYEQLENEAVSICQKLIQIPSVNFGEGNGNEKDIAIADLSITPKDVAEIVALVAAGELTDKLARQVVEGVIAGEGTPAEVVAKRGIKVVNDDGALMAAIEKVCAEQAETADKVRNGHVPAAGALKPVFTITFGELVSGVTSSSVFISEFSGDTATGSPVAATLTCKNARQAVIPCLAATSATNPLYSTTVLVNNTTDINGAVADIATQSITFTCNSPIVITTS